MPSGGLPFVAEDLGLLTPEVERLRDDFGMGWVDAPVSGGVPGAEAGTLAIMAGGDEADIEAVRPAVAPRQTAIIPNSAALPVTWPDG